MVQQAAIDTQLSKLGVKKHFWNSPEIKELAHIIAPNERLYHAVTGLYEGGIALLVATNWRLLLIDKKPWFLTIEDIRYDMISEVDYFSRLMDATMCVITLNKQLHFKSFKQHQLRDITKHIQSMVMALRSGEGMTSIQHELQSSDSHDGAKDAGDEIPANTIASQFQPVQSEQATSNTPGQGIPSSSSRLAAIARGVGRLAVDLQRRSRPIIAPLYPRPSLSVHQRYGRAYQQNSPVFGQKNI